MNSSSRVVSLFGEEDDAGEAEGMEDKVIPPLSLDDTILAKEG